MRAQGYHSRSVPIRPYTLHREQQGKDGMTLRKGERQRRTHENESEEAESTKAKSERETDSNDAENAREDDEVPEEICTLDAAGSEQPERSGELWKPPSDELPSETSWLQ